MILLKPFCYATEFKSFLHFAFERHWLGVKWARILQTSSTFHIGAPGRTPGTPSHKNDTMKINKKYRITFKLFVEIGSNLSNSHYQFNAFRTQE